MDLIEAKKMMVVLVLFLVLFISSIEMECCQCCSKVDSSFKRALSRKRRFVVFPKSSTILLTPSFTKALITGYPRGLVTSTEIDIYHPLPDTVDGWRPKIFDKPSTSPSPAETVMKDDIFSMKPDFSQSNWEASMPTGGGWKEKSKLDFSWNSPENIKWYSGDQLNKPWYNNYLKSAAYQYPQFWSNKRRSDVSQEKNYSSEDNWIHFRPHRERREIYRSIENAASLFGLDFKSCILRTICETKNFLLPSGKSLIQDVIRILFTIPTKDEWQDDYSKTIKSTDDNCSMIFKNACPFSVVEFLLHNERVI